MANVAYIRVSSQQQDLGRQKYLFPERNIKIDVNCKNKLHCATCSCNLRKT